MMAMDSYAVAAAYGQYHSGGGNPQASAAGDMIQRFTQYSVGPAQADPRALQAAYGEPGGPTDPHGPAGGGAVVVAQQMITPKLLETKVEEIIAENQILRTLLLEQSTKLWKLGQILEIHGITWASAVSKGGGAIVGNCSTSALPKSDEDMMLKSEVVGGDIVVEEDYDHILSNGSSSGNDEGEGGIDAAEGGRGSVGLEEGEGGNESSSSTSPRHSHEELDEVEAMEDRRSRGDDEEVDRLIERSPPRENILRSPSPASRPEREDRGDSERVVVRTRRGGGCVGIPEGLDEKMSLRVSCHATEGEENRLLRSINDAIRRATPGMTILIEEGLYIESLQINIPCRLLGIGNDVQLRHDKGNAVYILSDGVTLQNLHIRCDEDLTEIPSAVANNHCISVSGKDTLIEGCDMVTTRGHCIYCDPVMKNKNEVTEEIDSTFIASVKVRNSRVHHASNCGIFMTGRCQLNVESCQIEACGTAGIEVRDRADFVMEKSRIMNCSKSGVFAHSHASVTIVASDVNNCGMAGIELSKMSRGRVMNSRVFHGLKGGVFVHDHATMTLINNHIFANAMSNVDVRAKGLVDAESNKIYESRTSGVYVSAKGECTLRRNAILRNFGNGVELNTGKLVCLENTIYENQRCALFANGECWGEVRHNDMRFNRDKSIGNHSKGRLPKDVNDNKMDEGGRAAPSSHLQG